MAASDKKISKETVSPPKNYMLYFFWEVFISLGYKGSVGWLYSKGWHL